ncbi:hypothetical protein [Antrihabitans sp. YC2-6]|uniref:hypothetical protein n=1 Tax=Antrihabitans sp. YC2-6 TaxID=2799498 RepID=UPI0018F2A904|nr:hypothetical protein [Antrihabitans sp. YC2-6]MBJ8345665.1 hypothetical protein [Antrihabitans sp. YC2-6]
MTTKSLTHILLGTAAAAALSLGFAPGASAHPAGPWGVEGPCVGQTPDECLWSPSEDGLTWSLYGRTAHYDKLGNFVCQTGYVQSDAAYCDTLMTTVRALPQLPIGDWIWVGA